MIALGLPEVRSAVGSSGFYQLALFGLLVPYLAIKSARRISQIPLPSPRRYFTRVLTLQVMMAAISIAIAWQTRVELFPAPGFTGAHVLAGTLAMGLVIALSWRRWKARVINRDRRVYMTMPRNGTERLQWATVSLAAGIGEEVSYRGVFTSLLTRLVPLEVAILLAVAAFTVGHAGRGEKDLAFIAVVAFLMHGLVLYTGSLYIAMAVHFGYDLAAGLAYGWFGDKYQYPTEPLPPPEPAAAA